MNWLSVQLLGDEPDTLALERLECLLLPPPLCFVLLMSLLNAWGNVLELLQVATDGGRGSIERFAVLRLIAIGVAL